LTCFDDRLSESISDGLKRWLTMKDPGFDVREAFEPVAELLLPENFESFAMAIV
jgi:dihydropteroate synthase